MKNTIIGPFSEVVTMDGLPAFGPIHDSSLQVLKDAWIRVNGGIIHSIGDFDDIKEPDDDIVEINRPSVVIPGLIDAHTHICFAGNRAKDYVMRLSGSSYQEIASEGGGILDTVLKTRSATKEELIKKIIARANQLCLRGVTTCEVKSGYGLTVESELKILEAIREASQQQPVQLVATCLAAHVRPGEFKFNNEYLEHITEELFPIVKQKKLTRRIDIFVDEGAFSVEEAEKYLFNAKKQGFSVLLHANQFSRGGAQLAANIGALSADHLEHVDDEDFSLLKQAGVIPIMLPGATLGLGMPFPEARKALDYQLPLVIASDWNPGSAPMGDLLTQAALLGMQQKLTCTETLSAITNRAAGALQLEDRGKLKKGKRADFIVFPFKSYKEILYYQGSVKPYLVYINGKERTHGIHIS